MSIKRLGRPPPTIPSALWRWLTDQEFDPNVREGSLLKFTCDHGELWNTHRAEVLTYWTRENPGTRPTLWWRFESPEPRRSGESEREYLRRHRLLTPGEIKKAR